MAGAATHRLSVLFTPWGEGLTRSLVPATRWSTLSPPAARRRVAIQTNLAAGSDWLAEADPDALALWATYHPGQVAGERFLASCRDLVARGVPLLASASSACPSTSPRRAALRADLPAEVYLWVNAAEGHRYTDRRGGRWTAIDPLFGYSARPHAVAGRPCRAGETA